MLQNCHGCVHLDTIHTQLVPTPHTHTHTSHPPPPLTHTQFDPGPQSQSTTKRPKGSQPRLEKRFYLQ